MAAAVRAALYLRVSTGRQADSDLSIPDQRRQAKGYCASRGWNLNQREDYPRVMTRTGGMETIRWHFEPTLGLRH
jgi:DNA invertase Pin-like site-specific DNA recombinase